MPLTHSGGAVVVAPLVGETKVLLVKEITKSQPWYWKFMSETLKPGDTVNDALVRGLAQEYGLTDLAVKLDSTGIRPHVREIIDPRILEIRRLAEPEEIVLPARPPKYSVARAHTRHSRYIRTVDSIIESLSGKILVTEGEVERLETQAFFIGALHNLDFQRHRFLPQQLDLLEKLPELQAA